MQVGSDLAFFFSSGSAIVTGRGEGLRDTRIVEPIHLCLILPEFGCPTGAVYQAFDELSPDGQVDLAAVERCVVDRPLEPFNDLADPACHVQPPLGELRSRISNLTNQPVHITGSGAGMFIVASDAGEAAAMALEISESMGIVVKAVASLARPA